MKRIIISRKQFQKLNEVSLDVSAQANKANSNAVQNTIQNPSTKQQVKQISNATGDASLVVSNPKTTDDSPTLDINVNQGENPSEKISSNVDINHAIENGAKVRVHGSGFPQESKQYTKKTLEEMRLMNMKKNGHVFTKKELNEIFLNNN